MLAPLLLVRIPLLALEEAESRTWDRARTAQAARARCDRLLAATASRLVARLDVALAARPAQWPSLLALRRALRRGALPPQRLLTGDHPLLRLARATAARRARLAAAVDPDAAAQAEAGRLAALCRRPDWATALAVAAPDVAAQASRLGNRSDHRARMTRRTVARLAWRAAGRPAPMALFAATGMLVDGPADDPDAVSRRATVQRRTRAGVVPLGDAEAQAWQAAIADLAALPAAMAASHLREIGQKLGADKPVALSPADARALWIESQLSAPFRWPLPQAALGLVAELGSRFCLAGAARPWSTVADACALPRTGRMRLSTLATLAEPCLRQRFGALLDSAPLAALLAPLMNLPDCLDSRSLLQAGIAARQPVRAALRARPAEGGALVITHWGGDTMSVIAPYAHLAGCAERRAAWSQWLAGFGGADLPCPIPAARAAAQSGRPVPEGPWLGWQDSDVWLDDNGTAIARVHHPGVIAEQELRFPQRLLLAITRGPPTLLEAAIAAANARLARRIADWLAGDAPVLALPAETIDGLLVLAPPAFAVRAGTAVDAAWAALGAAGCRLGLAEVRRPGLLAEPRIVDLGTPDGMALAIADARSFSHLTPLRPAPGTRHVIEFLIELAA